MVKIVVHLRGIEYPEFRVDGKVQPSVRGPQRGVHVSRTSGAREDESQVAGAFRQRQQPLIGFRRDLDVGDVRHAARRLDAVDAAEQAAPRDRNHHHARGGVLAPVPRWILTERVTQQQFLQRDSGVGVRDSTDC